MAARESSLTYEVLARPSSLASDIQSKVQQECINLGRTCLDPLPDYQVFSSKPDFCENKILITARDEGENLVAFTSAVRLQIPGISTNVVHTGLTIVHPKVRRGSIVTSLFTWLFLQLLSENPEGLWLTSIAEVPSSLVHIALYCTMVHPCPSNPTGPPRSPTSPHLTIARVIRDRPALRHELAINPEATFDEVSFVFRGSNDWSGGRVFMKDVDDRQYWHRDKELNDFYRGLFRKNKGDEVLQIAFLDADHIMKQAELDRFAHMKAEAKRKLARL